jgi:hypothetical protein
MSPEIQEKILNNNKKISELLRENELLLRQEGYNPPAHNFALPPEERISFPPGYIRTVAQFNEKYHLREIFPHRHSRHNVTYALEVSDLFNYVFNRIHIWGAVETVFYKLALVNLVSIIEALLLEAANNICQNTKICKKEQTCIKHFNKNQRAYTKCALEKLVSLGVLDFDQEKLARVQDIIDLRNRIHIRLSPGNEMQLDDFNLRLYNEVIALLKDIDEQIYLKGVPLYGCS